MMQTMTKPYDVAKFLKTPEEMAGELDQAGTVFAAVIEQAKAAQDLRVEGRGVNGRGDVLVAQGDGPGSFSQAMDSDVGLGLMIQPLDSGIGFMSPIELLDSVCCFSP
jgi:hypothetical protein